VVVAGGVVGATVSTGRSVERLEEWFVLVGGVVVCLFVEMSRVGWPSWRNRSVGGRNKCCSTNRPARFHKLGGRCVGGAGGATDVLAMRSAGRVKRPHRWGVGGAHVAIRLSCLGGASPWHNTKHTATEHAHVRNVVGRTDKQKTMVPHTHAEEQANIRHARGGPSRGMERAWWRGGWEGAQDREAVPSVVCLWF